MSMDVPGEEKGINGFILSVLFWEKVSPGFPISKPVLRKNVKGGPGKDGIPVRTVFPMRDVDAHIGAGDILITEGADFADTQAGGIHDGDHGFWLEIRDGRDKMPGFLL